MKIYKSISPLYLFLVFTTWGQTSNLTKIISPGNLISTPSLPNEAMEKLKKQYGTSGYHKIETNSNQSKWPSGISNSNGRYQNRDLFENYMAYLIAELNSNMVLLYIPASENQHMPEQMRPLYDIFFVMNAQGVARGPLVHPDINAASGVSPVANTNKTAAANKREIENTGNTDMLDLKKFYKEFRALVADYKSDFSKAKGNELKSELTELIGNSKFKKYASNLPLTASATSYLDNLNGLHLAFNAEFGSFSNRKEAESLLVILESFTDTVKITCCTLTMQRTLDKDGMPILAYKPEHFYDKNSFYYTGFNIRYTLKKALLKNSSEFGWHVRMRIFKEQSYNLF